MTTFIYCLIDPRNGEIRYVGKSNNIEQRLKAHINPARYKSTHKFNWLKSLRDLGLKPIMRLLEEVPIEDWKIREKYWIRYFYKKGFNLTNYTRGGDGLSFGNQTSFKKGNKSWNKGKARIQTCQICNTSFQNINKKKTCSKLCEIKYREIYVNPKAGFKKSHTPWNKGVSGYTNRKKGQKLSQETKDKIRSSLLGKPSKKKRIVRQLDKNNNLINTYPSITEASKFTGIKGISNVLAGLAKTAGGYIWL